MSRLLGLALLRHPPSVGLLLPGARSVHTFGMRFALDLIWLDAKGRPVRVDLAVTPNRVRSCLAARSVIESASGRVDEVANPRKGAAMGQNADTVKQAWEDFSRGDFDSAVDAMHEDARWEGSNSDRVPGGGGSYEGKQGIRQMIEELGDPWEDFRPTPDEFIEQGDTVIVLGHTEAKAKATGKEIRVPFVQVWRMRDGKGERVQALTDTAVVAEAVES